MPPIGGANVDTAAVKLISEWVRQLSEVEHARTNWTIEDFLGLLDQMSEKPDGAEIENGKRVFISAGCVQCHRIGKQGQGFGPDLSNIGKRREPRNILQSILEPSEEIAPEYRSWLYRLSNGEVVEGVKVNESDQSIGIMVKDGSGRIMAIPKAEVLESSRSSVSSMPSGLLSALSREDILGLLVYLTNATD
jgi:putative heme-binding domain-containing protein